ncbi:hypothetical protein JOM49_008411 [Amycolatopsis magusensis]|uniref:Uncharacterized protein n=1 Tax=Amycolatopsis magusensis TaxID=882444 RepID=A0ABS4Q5D4_9PSEU|nr:hypothetical protein [Amycolatopsis magusensis]
MFAHWIQIAELFLLPLGLWLGYSAGRICRRDERASFHSDTPVTHPDLSPERPAHAPFLEQSSRGNSTRTQRRLLLH